MRRTCSIGCPSCTNIVTRPPPSFWRLSPGRWSTATRPSRCIARPRKCKSTKRAPASPRRPKWPRRTRLRIPRRTSAHSSAPSPVASLAGAWSRRSICGRFPSSTDKGRSQRNWRRRSRESSAMRCGQCARCLAASNRRSARRRPWARSTNRITSTRSSAASARRRFAAAASSTSPTTQRTRHSPSGRSTRSPRNTSRRTSRSKSSRSTRASRG